MCYFNRNSYIIFLNIFEGYDFDGIYEYKSVVEVVNVV